MHYLLSFHVAKFGKFINEFSCLIFQFRWLDVYQSSKGQLFWGGANDPFPWEHLVIVSNAIYRSHTSSLLKQSSRVSLLRLCIRSSTMCKNPVKRISFLDGYHSDSERVQRSYRRDIRECSANTMTPPNRSQLTLPIDHDRCRRLHLEDSFRTGKYRKYDV
ncbi:hypothetical protein GQ44DRAFT_207305 [Phaeosphaeriaceae sp. PMI808]|nr:hypothetical protein GQ44DRAFT_207305 [Phaeosphaeriaceae sp. PMI808]